MEANLKEGETAEEVETETPEEILPGTEETGDEVNPDTEDEDVISIGEDSPPHEEKEDSKTIKDMRKELNKRKDELKEKDKELKKYTAAPVSVELGSKPSLESSGHDPAVFEKDLEAWQNRKRVHDEEVRKRDEAAKANEDKWQTTLQNHDLKKKELKVKDIDEVEATVVATLSETQLGIIKHTAANSAKVIVALGTNAEKLKELALIQDPLLFCAAMAKLETTVKTNKRAATKPEGTVSGSASLSGGKDAHYDKLEKEADKTGDRSKFIAYKRKLKQEKE